MPWDDARLDAVEAEATACESGDACTPDVLALVVEVRRLTAEHAALRVEVAAAEQEIARLREALQDIKLRQAIGRVT